MRVIVAIVIVASAVVAFKCSSDKPRSKPSAGVGARTTTTTNTSAANMNAAPTAEPASPASGQPSRAAQSAPASASTGAAADSAIRAQLDARFEEAGIREISISASGGEVTLRGIVEGSQKKELAERIALDTPGVRKVINLIEVIEAPEPATSRPPPINTNKPGGPRDMPVNTNKPGAPRTSP